MDNQNPTVYNAPQQPVSHEKKWFQPKYIFFFLIGVIIVEVIIGAKTLLTPPVQNKNNNTLITAPKEAVLVLIPNKKVYKVGENVFVNIHFSSGDHKVVGTDAVLSYDPKVLEASKSAFTKGNVYKDYPLVKVDSKEGTIRVSGITQVNSPGFEGVGSFGTVAFKAKSAGSTELKLDFKEGVTSESNVTEAKTAKDVLGKVYNLKINIE